MIHFMDTASPAQSRLTDVADETNTPLPVAIFGASGNQTISPEELGRAHLAAFNALEKQLGHRWRCTESNTKQPDAATDNATTSCTITPSGTAIAPTASNAAALSSTATGSVVIQPTSTATSSTTAPSAGIPLRKAAYPVVLVLHASVGSGHRSAAVAIAQALEEIRQMQTDNTADSETDAVQSPSLPSNCRIVVIDILAWGAHVFDGNKYATGFTGSTRPIYDLIWRYTFTGRALWGQGTFLNYLLWSKFTRYLAYINPLAVVATHIMGANMAAGGRIINRQSFPLICVPTDYETEGLWPHRAADCFCVGTESMAETLRARKVDEARIALTGIPTRLDFCRTYDTDTARNRLGLPRDKKLILALAGATLPQPYVNLRRILNATLPVFAAHPDFHLVMVCGRDSTYADGVRSLCRALHLSNVTVMEYVEGMAELMASSNLIITKSGGLTVTECLCASTPMILVGRAYGQEKANVNMLTSNGAAMHVTTSRELIDVLNSIDAHPERIAGMVMNANLLRLPNAALDVARKTAALAKAPAKNRLGHIPRRPGPLALFSFYWGDKPAHIR